MFFVSIALAAVHATQMRGALARILTLRIVGLKPLETSKAHIPVVIFDDLVIKNIFYSVRDAMYNNR